MQVRKKPVVTNVCLTTTALNFRNGTIYVYK
nr:MAG TPA: hypothetical protein [Caudoviricetes sp.]